MQNKSPKVGRRALLTGAALTAVAAAARVQTQTQPAEPVTTLADTPPSSSTVVTVERRGQIVLIGLNRPSIQNRLDPPTRVRVAETFYQYEHDPSLRAAVLFGHGEHFSRGIDVDASQAAIAAGRRTPYGPEAIDPLGKSKPHLSKPVVVVAHGDTWNLGHEIYLAGDNSNRGGEHAIRPGREHARAVPRRRRDGALRPGGGMGECHALHADGRSLERGGVLPDGDHPGDRSYA